MKTQKLNLKSIKNALSRVEMKKIMAGSGFGCCVCFPLTNVCKTSPVSCDIFCKGLGYSGGEPSNNCLGC